MKGVASRRMRIVHKDIRYRALDSDSQEKKEVKDRLRHTSPESGTQCAKLAGV